MLKNYCESNLDSTKRFVIQWS